MFVEHLSEDAGDMQTTRGYNLHMSTRLNININDETAAVLREIAAADDTSVTEVVRRAVSAYKFFRDAAANGQDIELHGKGPMRVVNFL